MDGANTFDALSCHRQRLHRNAPCFGFFVNARLRVAQQRDAMTAADHALGFRQDANFLAALASGRFGVNDVHDVDYVVMALNTATWRVVSPPRRRTARGYLA